MQTHSLLSSSSSASPYCNPCLPVNSDPGGVLEVLQGQQSQREGPVLLQHGSLCLQAAPPCSVTSVRSLLLLLWTCSETLCCSYFHFNPPCDQCCCGSHDRGCCAVELKNSNPLLVGVRLGQVRSGLAGALRAIVPVRVIWQDGRLVHPTRSAPSRIISLSSQVNRSQVNWNEIKSSRKSSA
jgi:hypothetical protein